MLRRIALSALLLVAGSLPPLAIAQEAGLTPPLADDHSGWVERGVLEVIPPEPQEGETVTQSYELHEIRKGIPGLDYTSSFEAKNETVYEKAKEVTLRRPIWALEFSFKPVRMIEVDVPQPEGKMRRKNIWYMLYRVRNLGGHLDPNSGARYAQSEDVRSRKLANEIDDNGKKLAEAELKEEKVFRSPELAGKLRAIDGDSAEAFDRDFPETKEPPKEPFPRILFFPTIVLEAHDMKKSYLDRVIPSALEAIAKRERVGKPIYDSVSISRQKIEITTPEKDNSVWGVAMWENVDPRIDYFSVAVGGLTNAYQFEDKPEEFQAGDEPGKGRTFKRKTLLLHFWRPGDTIEEHEREISYGMPVGDDPADQQRIDAAYGEKDRLDYRWIYR